MTVTRARCAVHPGRPALDRCPRCGRARCRPDAEQHLAGCAACGRPAAGSRRAIAASRVIAAGLAGLVVVWVGGPIVTQYVGTHIFSLVAPALLGLAAGWAASAAGGTGTRSRLPAVGAALLGTALGFRLVPGGQSPLHTVAEVGPPYLCAVAGAVLWPVLFGARR